MLYRATLLGAFTLPLFLELDLSRPEVPILRDTTALRATSAARAESLDDVLKRGAAEGESRTRTFTSKRAMSVTEYRISIDGEEIPAEQLGNFESSTTDASTFVMVDAFEKVGEGRPTKFVRSYSTLESASELEGGMLMMAGGDGSLELESELEGEDVVFTLDAASGEYTARFPENSTADVALLADLAADLDFAELLPKTRVAEGDEWELALELFEKMVEPGGDLKLRPTDMPDGVELGDPIDAPDIEPVLDGKFTAKLVGFRDDEGVRIAVVELVFDIEAKLDLSSTLAAQAQTQETPEGNVDITPIEMRVDRQAEGKGTLIWNVERGCLVSLEIAADVTEVNHHTIEVDFGGNVMEQAQVVTTEGEMQLEFTIE